MEYRAKDGIFHTFVRFCIAIFDLVVMFATLFHR